MQTSVRAAAKHFAATLSLVGIIPLVASGGAIPIQNEVTETMMQSEAADSLFLVNLFGLDTTTTLHFGSIVDPSGRSFSYSLLPGQTYLGQAISLSLAASYDPSLGQYDLTETGQLGSQSWTEMGSGVWTGDPFTLQKTYRTNGVDYPLTCMVNFDATFSTSAGTCTFMGTPFPGPYPGNDSLHFDGSWDVVIIIPADPIRGIPSTTISASQGMVPFPGGGVGNFQLLFTPVPEPTTWLISGTGLLSLLAFGWRQRKMATPQSVC